MKPGLRLLSLRQLFLFAKGSLVTHNGSAQVELPIGTDGQVLKADSTTSTGLKWAAESGGGGGGSTPTGTGFRRVTSGVEDGAAVGETGTGNVVRATSPTITTPTVASFANATHNHQNAAGGGTLDAAAIGAGTLGAARLPALTGDVTSSAGSAATTLASVGTAGTYRSVTTDAKGRVTAGTNPTTFAGYGLSDTSANLAAAISDETGSGALVFSTSPVLSSPTVAASQIQFYNSGGLSGFQRFYAGPFATSAFSVDRYNDDNTYNSNLFSVAFNGDVSIGGNVLTATTVGYLDPSSSVQTQLNSKASLTGAENLTNKTLTTPTIASFTNATHNHQNAAGGGTLDTAALGSGTLNAARMPALTGDVTTSAGAIATTIANNAVTTAKIADANVTLAKVANIATAKLLGRNTAGSGVTEELGTIPSAVQDNITRLGTVVAGSIAAITPALTGDVTASAGSQVTTLATVTIGKGGTGQTTAAAALDALNQTAGTSLASAATTDIGAQASQTVTITGTATISSFGTVAAGTKRVLIFSSTPTLTHNATSMILPGAASITVEAGDMCEAVSLGSGNWRVYNYERADGSSVTVRKTDIQVFTSTGANTWTMPANAKWIEVRLIAGGAGGGSGRRGPSGTAQGGGAGGAGGGHSFATFNAASITSPVTVTVGAGGAGGAARTADNTDGASGTVGGTSSFGAYIIAGGGGAGGGGASAAGGSASAGNRSFAMYAGNPGAAGSAGAASGASGTGGSSALGLASGSGGGGGGVDADGTTPRSGGIGGNLPVVFSTTSQGGGSPGTSGGNGSNGAIYGTGIYFPGAGGGGGGGKATGAAGTGGNGALYGGGGGGGGASLNGFNSGAGGNGGDGVAVVTTYF